MSDLIYLLSETEEFEYLGHGFDFGVCEALENSGVLIEDVENAFRLVAVNVSSKSHL